MRLAKTAEFRLPDKVGGPIRAGSCLVSGVGVFYAVVWWDGGARYALVSIADQVVQTVLLDELGDPFDAYDAPAPVLLDDGAFGVIADAGTLRMYGTDLRLRREITIAGDDVLHRFAKHGQRPRVTGHASRGALAAEHVVVLDEPIGTGNPRYLAFLRIGETSASWTRIGTLGPDGFPVDRFGDDQLNQGPDVSVDSCIIGDAVGHSGSMLVCVEGSHASSVRKYGADFFTITRVTPDGTVMEPLYQQSGWKRLPGKHAINGKVTSSGRYVLLTPVFATGEWKGRQRLFDLGTGEVLEPVLPRGAAKMRIVDHAGTTFWLSDGAQRILCAEVEGPHG
ncbi:hypothetical protein ACSCB1_36510 [Streptomyces europaeiscabiei]|uniref:Uncharacterized protein n=1 Tax=Streptomyces europaeiscabiei TaxID=146819 RepID=A0ABU4NZD5_9ACTN|nr:hypothetical protein [Streptomyces europaeiscabiei]MDX2526249.1 hypothetical protein [Streptomyces europaeiscabiei]MDX3550147.1 hypothetical protein [Streptomyces europaeiscabiei]MDX3552070.1 hypothetical protein [Streptomyces europaeiscabiei]MDX3665894.1 hypothetical protein [Streptomyces europaeiscabiei]MDX3707337.1 hypothetical protein [Streptomyces europaeiscabiei]